MEDHAMRGENFDDPVVRPPLLAQIAHGVGGLADEAEANGQVAAPGPSRVALETEGTGDRKISREARMGTEARGESPGAEEGGGRGSHLAHRPLRDRRRRLP